MVKTEAITDIIKKVSPYYAKKGEPEAEHNMNYDSSSETLEPVYFFILDLMNEFGLKPEKLVDNFVSTPGSGHFAELGQRATRMQDEGIKIFGVINTVVRSILNIVYDLKEFKIRLQDYNSLKAKKKEEKEGAELSLKQIWMDKVDITKGNSSIKAMALGQAGFQTLLDAFLIVKDEDDVKKLDLNDRVKRIVKQRLIEYKIWLEQSEKELRKRYEMERNYLRSQVNTLKIYSRWAKPYMTIAKDLEMTESGRRPELVKTFNTILLELTLLGKKEVKVEEAALAGDLPLNLKKFNPKRKYYSCVLVDFKFRGIPQRVSQQAHYVFGGRAEVTFRAYALNEDEIAKMNLELDKSDINDAFNLIEGATTESLEQLQGEINSFLDEDGEEESKSKDESNPFLALFGYYNKESEKKGKGKNKDLEAPVRKDDFIEKEHLRRLAAATSEKTAFDLFDIYKKSHGMPSYT